MKLNGKAIKLLIILLLGLLFTGCSGQEPMPPTSTPKPTWTPTPHGTFIGCIYYEGKLVNGFINYYDENENYIKDMDSGASTCNPVMLTPGFYWVAAEYWGSTDCSDGCFPEGEMISIEISDGEVIEMDFTVVQK